MLSGASRRARTMTAALRTTSPPTARPKSRVLVLDEDRILLQSLAQLLRRDGYDVKTADDPNAARNLLDAEQVDLLLADINMPGLRGGEFLKDLRRRHAHVVTVVITSYGSIEDAVQATKRRAGRGGPALCTP